MLRIAILASHRGSNLQAIIDASNRGEIDAEPALVISNNSQAGALLRANEAGIQTLHLSSHKHPDTAALDVAMCDALRQHNIDLVVTAGYMKRLGKTTMNAYTGRIVNIHPSLLPKHGGKGMYGMKVHEAVIAAGDKETGATVHHVEGDYDTGPIIAQRRIDVLPDDTPQSLAARLLPVEHALLVDTIRQLNVDKTA